MSRHDVQRASLQQAIAAILHFCPELGGLASRKKRCSSIESIDIIQGGGGRVAVEMLKRRTGLFLAKFDTDHTFTSLDEDIR
mmetsp:Transcript_8530/g.18418  ORF Transcript_8530/g.18418 Transcript_8530/m.18418 type:complete len:82 (-) Transcript_8530:35-280(-)